MKTIVTHFGPDLDAITSCWLVKKFMPGFDNAEITFVAAGKTLLGKKPDSDPNVIHVDTGFGRFDHHQANEHTCAAKLVFEYLFEKEDIKEKHKEPLRRLVEQVVVTDHFEQVFWEKAADDRYEFFAEGIIDGWRLIYPRESNKIIELGFEILEAIYHQLSNKVWAEQIIKEEGKKFNTKWGKGLGFETMNDEVVSLAQKMGYTLVIRKDPRKGYVRIKTLPKKEIDLTNIYNILSSKDPDATWFLHSGKHMLLNGSTKNPDMKPTKLKLEEIIEIIRNLDKVKS